MPVSVTRLLGQSPSGLSATGESDVRNYYDMIAARQELDLRPQLERLDRLICWSEDIDEGALSFAFRPLWQLDEPARAALALSRSQMTQVYAGLKLWPDEVMARLAEAQLIADGTYPNAAAVFAERAGEVVIDAREVGAVPRASSGFWPGETEPRDWHGRWTTGAGAAPQVRGAQVAQAGEGPFAGGDPNIEENLQRMEKEQERPLRISPNLVPREEPDGTVKRADPSGIFFAAPQVSRAAPAATAVTPSTPAQPLPSAPAVKPDLRGIVGPGAYAREGIPASSPRRLTAAERRQNTANGYRWGCHWCGTKDPGTDSGNFVGDHQDPTAINPEGKPQLIYPHCQRCSARQGGFVRWLKERGYEP